MLQQADDFSFLGETGIGKSTLMNTLFNTTFETEEASHYESAVRLRPRTYDLQESNVHLKLTIVDAVGFGDQINKDERQVSCHLLGISGLASAAPVWAAGSPACSAAEEVSVSR